ncbi:MAG: hypothetical protein Q9202_006014 [Teloschistes flavicans]
MKLLLAYCPLFLSTLAASHSFLAGSLSQKPLVDLSVPGDNPLEFCSDPSGFILTIDYVDLEPNPPVKGHALQIKAKGNFTETIEQDAYINLSVKYGLITLVNTKADLCEQMKEVDATCPLNGVKDFTKEVNLPKEIPPGRYTVLADVYTKDDEKVTCLKAQVQF